MAGVQSSYRVYASQIDRPGCWPVLYYVTLPSHPEGSNKIVWLFSGWKGRTLVGRERTLDWIIDNGMQASLPFAGTLPGNLQGLVAASMWNATVDVAVPNLGAGASRCVALGKDGNCYFLGSDGILYQYDGANPPRSISESIRNLLVGDRDIRKYLGEQSDISKSVAIANPIDGEILFFLPTREVSDNAGVLGLPNTGFIYNEVYGTLSPLEKLKLRGGQWSRWFGQWVMDAARIGRNVYVGSSLPDATIRAIDNPANATDANDLTGLLQTGTISSATATTFRDSAGPGFPNGLNKFAGYPVAILDSAGNLQQVNWVIANDISQTTIFTVAVPFSPTPVPNQLYVIGHIPMTYQTGWIDHGSILLKKRWRSLTLKCACQTAVPGSGTGTYPPNLIVTVDYSNDQNLVIGTQKTLFTVSTNIADYTMSIDQVAKYMRVTIATPVPNPKIAGSLVWWVPHIYEMLIRYLPIAEAPL